MPILKQTADAPDKFTVATAYGDVDFAGKEVEVKDAALAAEVALTPFVEIVTEKPVKASSKEEK